MIGAVWASMEHAEYVYTTGMAEKDIEGHLRAQQNGVLALANRNNAYGVPLSYYFDGERILLRVSDHEEQVTKREYLNATETATFVLFDYSDVDSWSILIQGPITEWDQDVSEQQLNEWFPPFRLFDEEVGEVEFVLYGLEMQSVVGRKTASSHLENSSG